MSKFLALVLRHDPQRIGLELDVNGWANVDDLLRLANAHGIAIDETDLRRVVSTNSKQRFVIDDDTRRVRANQGHSVDIDLGLEAVHPPVELFHGTALVTLDAILANGIKPMRRTHVHLSSDLATAHQVGRRHGTSVVLIVDAERMSTDGRIFFRSDNGVWLTSEVPTDYIVRTDP